MNVISFGLACTPVVYVYIKGEIFGDWVFWKSCDSWGACAILAFRLFIVLDHPGRLPAWYVIAAGLVNMYVINITHYI